MQSAKLQSNHTFAGKKHFIYCRKRVFFMILLYYQIVVSARLDYIANLKCRRLPPSTPIALGTPRCLSKPMHRTQRLPKMLPIGSEQIFRAGWCPPGPADTPTSVGNRGIVEQWRQRVSIR